MRRSVLVLVVLVSAVAAPAWAQSVATEAEREALRGVPDRWGFNVGSFWQTFDANVRLDASVGETGTEIDLEADPRLPENQVNLVVAGFYRFSARHQVHLSYVGWSRSRSTTIERQIEWGDVIYDVGLTVSSDESGKMLNGVYKYSFFNNGNVVFGLNGGVSCLRSDTTLSGEGRIAGGGTASATLSESLSTTVPVPLVGAHFEMTLTKRLFWKAQGNYFAATISGYDGSLSQIETSVAYYFKPNFGVRAGFYATKYRIEKSGRAGGDYLVKYGFGGPVVEAVFTF